MAVQVFCPQALLAGGLSSFSTPWSLPSAQAVLIHPGCEPLSFCLSFLPPFS